MTSPMRVQRSHIPSWPGYFDTHRSPLDFDSPALLVVERTPDRCVREEWIMSRDSLSPFTCVTLTWRYP
jgi:hypothetical protein